MIIDEVSPPNTVGVIGQVVKGHARGLVIYYIVTISLLSQILLLSTLQDVMKRSYLSTRGGQSSMTLHTCADQKNA